VIVVKLVVAFTTTMLVNLILKLIEHRQLAKNPD